MNRRWPVRSATFAAAVAVFSACAAPRPAEAPPCGPLDVGVLDLQAVLDRSVEGKKAKDDLQLVRSVLSREQLREQHERELGRIFRALDPLIARLAAAHRMRFVLEVRDSRVLYAAPSLQLTDALIALYDSGGAGELPTCSEDGSRRSLRAWWVEEGIDWADAQRWVEGRGGEAVFGRDVSKLIYAAPPTDVTAVVTKAPPPREAPPADRPFAVANGAVVKDPAALERVAKERRLALIIDKRALLAVTPDVPDVTDELAR